MRIHHAAVVILLQASSPAVSFSSSRHRGGAASLAKEQRQEAAKVGKEHNDSDLLEDSHPSCVVRDEFVPRKGSLAAGGLGAVTSHFSAEKVCQGNT